MRYLNHKGPKTEEKDNDSLPRPEANCSGKGKCDLSCCQLFIDNGSVVYVNNLHKILFYAGKSNH